VTQQFYAHMKFVFEKKYITSEGERYWQCWFGVWTSQKFIFW